MNADYLMARKLELITHLIGLHQMLRRGEDNWNVCGPNRTADLIQAGIEHLEMLGSPNTRFVHALLDDVSVHVMPSLTVALNEARGLVQSMEM